MKKVLIHLQGMQEIKDFVNMLQKHQGDFDLKSGRYVTDAKSLLGIFSLDLTGWLELVIHQEDETIMHELETYMQK